MTDAQQVITYWIEKAYQDLASARDNFAGKRFQNAVSDAYFACFHAFGAVLFQEGKAFRKHIDVQIINYARLERAAWVRRTVSCVVEGHD